MTKYPLHSVWQGSDLTRHPHSPAAHVSRRRQQHSDVAAAAVRPVPFQPPGTMSSGLDMSLDDLIKQSKSRPKSNPASSSGPARRAPPAARAAPYPPAAPKVRRVCASRPPCPRVPSPPQNPNAAGPCLPRPTAPASTRRMGSTPSTSPPWSRHRRRPPRGRSRRGRSCTSPTLTPASPSRMSRCYPFS